MSDEAQLDDLKRLPLDGWHRVHGARMVPFAGYEMPVQYEGIIAHGSRHASPRRIALFAVAG